MEKSTISINKNVLKLQKNIEVEGDIIVPDSKPDIVSIINTNSSQYIYKEEFSEGRYKFDGNIDSHIIYLSDDGETKCIGTTFNFMDIIDDPKIDENTVSKYRIEVCNIETKILNERKVNLKITLNIYFSFYINEKIEYLDGIGELSNIEKLEKNVQINTLMASNKIKTSLKENINIEEASDVIEILNTEVFITNIENKISYNKVLSKADANIEIFYMTENKVMRSVNATFPIMNFIDIEKISDENTCEIDYKIRNMLFKANSKEMKSIDCQIDFEVTCEAYSNKNLTIVQDMYGIGKNILFTKKDIQIQTGELVNKDINLSENVFIEDIKKLFFVDARANIINKVSNGNSCNYEGEVTLDIYYESINNLNVKQIKIPFATKFEINSDDVKIEFVKKEFYLNNEDVNCNLNIRIILNDSALENISLIESIEESDYEKQSDYAMVVYFVKDGDTVWDIARNFRISINDIRKMNNLSESDEVKCGERLYIMR